MLRAPKNLPKLVRGERVLQRNREKDLCEFARWLANLISK